MRKESGRQGVGGELFKVDHRSFCRISALWSAASSRGYARAPEPLKHLCTARQENRLAVSYRVRTPLSYHPAAPVLAIVCKRKESICPHTDLDTNIPSTVVPNSPKLETF